MKKAGSPPRKATAATAKKTRAKPVARDEAVIEHLTPAGRSVFHELFPAEQAAELAIRADLLVAMRQWLAASALTQAAAAEKLGITQARVSDLTRGKIDRFSLDQLIRLAARAGLQPRITLAPVPTGKTVKGLIRRPTTAAPHATGRA